MKRNGSKYSITSLEVNAYGIDEKAAELSRPFLSLATSINDTIQYHVSFTDITPEELEALAAELRVALATYEDLVAYRATLIPAVDVAKQHEDMKARNLHLETMVNKEYTNG